MEKLGNYISGNWITGDGDGSALYNTMKSVITIFFAAALNINSFGQIIEVGGRGIDCDSAYTTLDLGLCSRFLLEQSMGKYDSLSIRINECLDTLIEEDKQLRKDMLQENPQRSFDFWTDYSKIKNMFNQSDTLFQKLAAIDADIAGEFYGIGRERTIGENLTKKHFYDNRIRDLTNMIEMHCGE